MRQTVRERGSTNGLTGIGVWVTRPSHQAEPLAKRVERLGGQAVRLPVIAITDVAQPQAVIAIVDRLERFDLAIFVSANAVRQGLRYVSRRNNRFENWAPEDWPEKVQIAAIGKATAKTLAVAGLSCAFEPSAPYNSEALLAVSALQKDMIIGRRVLIFRGVGGRTLLGDTLAARAAKVEYADVYQRTLPPWRQTIAIPWQSIQVIVVTSTEGLENLFAIVHESEHQRLCETPFVVISQRMVEVARRLGIKNSPIFADNASDDGILDALLNWADKRNNLNPAIR